MTKSNDPDDENEHFKQPHIANELSGDDIVVQFNYEKVSSNSNVVILYRVSNSCNGLNNTNMIVYTDDVNGITVADSPQFRIEEYVPPFRYDRNSNGGGILFFIREDIPTKIISITLLKDFEGIFVELNFCKKKLYYVVAITLIRILSQII